MPGLRLNTYGSGGIAAYGTQGNTAGNQPSVTAAAFGPGATTSQQSGWGAIFPNDPGGIAFCAGILGLAMLVIIRHSLPR